MFLNGDCFLHFSLSLLDEPGEPWFSLNFWNRIESIYRPQVSKSLTIVIVPCPPTYTDVWWLVTHPSSICTLWSPLVVWVSHATQINSPFYSCLQEYKRERNQQDEERSCFLVCSVRLVLWGNVVGGPVCWVQRGATTPLKVWEIRRCRYTHVTGRRPMSAVVFACHFERLRHG